jgi:hypothetical protein
MRHMLPVVDIDRVLRRRGWLHFWHAVQSQRAQRVLLGDLAGRLGGVVGVHVDTRLPVNTEKADVSVK